MKIKLSIILFILSLIMLSESTYAYANFEDFEKVGSGKLLSEFTDSDYEDNYKLLPDPTFMGWHTMHVTESLKVKYISETLFSYYNNGKSAIQYNYKASKKTLSSYSLQVTGGLKLETKKDNKVFGDGLKSSINVEYEYEYSQEEVESYDIKVSIEPQTQMVLYLYGEGTITNGVAKNYFFFIETSKGGYEIFVVTTHYQRLEITPI